MKYFISSLGFWNKNVTSILNKKYHIVVKRIGIQVEKKLWENVNNRKRE
jgi:hypothetical protein